MRRFCFNRLKHRSTWLRWRYKDWSNLPRRRSLSLRGMVIRIPRLRKKLRILLLLYPLSPLTRLGRNRGRPTPTRRPPPCCEFRKLWPQDQIVFPEIMAGNTHILLA